MASRMPWATPIPLSMRANGHIDYEAFRSALDDVRRHGIAPRVCLPFATRPGQVVNIGGEEYRVQSAVCGDGETLAGAAIDEREVVGFKVKPL